MVRSCAMLVAVVVVVMFVRKEVGVGIAEVGDGYYDGGNYMGGRDEEDDVEKIDREFRVSGRCSDDTWLRGEICGWWKVEVYKR